LLIFAIHAQLVESTPVEIIVIGRWSGVDFPALQTGPVYRIVLKIVLYEPAGGWA